MNRLQDVESGPLSDADWTVLRRAIAARQSLRGAVRTAKSSAVSTLCIAVLGLPVVMLWPSWIGLAAEAALFTIGTIEWIGAGRMRQGVPSAATLLGRNQLVFLSLVSAYCVFQMVSFARLSAAGGLISRDMRSALASMPELQDDLEAQLKVWGPVATYGGYSLIIVLSIGFQGGLAWYYFSRRPRLQAAQDAAPAWVLRLLAEVGRLA